MITTFVSVLLLLVFDFQTNYPLILVIPQPWFKRLKSQVSRAGSAFKSYRLCRVPKLYWFIIIFYGGFLIRLMFLFSSIYEHRALVTMIVTNILLYGLADTLAQTLSSIAEFKPDTSAYNIKFLLEKSVLSESDSVQLRFDDSDDEEEEADALLELGLADDFTFASTNGGASQPNPLSRKDSLSSNVSKYTSGYNFRRLSLFMMWGLIQTFMQFSWYAILNDVYSEDNLFLSALKRVLSDQLCYSPLSLGLFFVYTTVVMEGGDLDAVKAKLRARYLQTLVVNYAVWPLTQFINFLLLPTALQVPFASTVGVFWNAYLSLKNAKG